MKLKPATTEAFFKLLAYRERLRNPTPTVWLQPTLPRDPLSRPRQSACNPVPAVGRPTAVIIER